MQLTKLAGQLLLATPALKDPNFSDGVVLLCHHDEDGSMGLMINRQQTITVQAVLEDLKLAHPNGGDLPTFEGGPVDPFRGFVLHDGWHMYESTLPVTPEINLTTSRDVLEDIGNGVGPEQFMLVLGYAGWGGGQLEEEIGRNDWLVAPASNHIIFQTPADKRWMLCAKSMGVDKAQLSIDVGHA